MIFSIRGVAAFALGTGAVSLCWLLFTGINQAAFDAFNIVPDVHLVYLPAGVRLLVLLIFRWQGAIGMGIAHPVEVMSQFPSASILFVGVQTLISAIIPFLLLKSCMRALNISPGLTSLQPIQLPILSLLMALAVPMMLRVSAAAFGFTSWHEAVLTYPGMVLGDFLGCLLVLLISLGGIRIVRKCFPVLRRPAA